MLARAAEPGSWLGILRFLLAYALNQKQLGHLGLEPSFLAHFVIVH